MSASDESSIALIEVRRLPGDPRRVRACETAVALALGVPFEQAKSLLARLPARLPLPRPSADEDILHRALRDAGAEVELPLLTHPPAPCVDHPRFVAEAACTRCHDPICTLCSAQEPDARCARCTRKKQRSRSFYLVRVAVLLTILVGVALYAVQDIRSRAARNDWSRPLDVAIIVIAEQPLEDGVVDQMRERADALEDRLHAELERHSPGHARPFSIEVFGPIVVDGNPPAAPGDGLLAEAGFAWDLRRFTGRADDAAGISSRRFDSRIYVIARPPVSKDRKLVEGLSQQGGRVGIVRVDLDAAMIDFAFFVATHELFHTLGASDKYDSTGAPMVPDGLAEPELQPRFPQRLAEVMARHRAVAPNKSVPPKLLSELAVGQITAREIGWIPP